MIDRSKNGFNSHVYYKCKNYCLINMTKKYLLENHLISIKYTKPVSKELLIEKYNSIINSFDNPKTKEFINLYFGNNAINTTELKYILPIFNI